MILESKVAKLNLNYKVEKCNMKAYDINNKQHILEELIDNALLDSLEIIKENKMVRLELEKKAIL